MAQLKHSNDFEYNCCYAGWIWHTLGDIEKNYKIYLSNVQKSGLNILR